jgi:hypothetical protein
MEVTTPQMVQRGSPSGMSGKNAQPAMVFTQPVISMPTWILAVLDAYRIFTMLLAGRFGGTGRVLTSSNHHLCCTTESSRVTIFIKPSVQHARVGNRLIRFRC